MVIPAKLRKCVGFLCYRDKANQIRYAGTCLFLRERTEYPEGAFTYTITAKHVVIGVREKSIDGKLIVRVNKNIKDGGYEDFDTSIEDWISNPDDPTDVSITDWAPPPGQKYEIVYLETDVIQSTNVGSHLLPQIGDDVFIVGLFRDYTGLRNIQPIVRTGNVAMIPDEKIPTNQYGNIDAYLIESRSIGGLSGSPVFVHMYGFRLDENDNPVRFDARHIYLLGIIFGHYDLDLPNQDDVADASTLWKMGSVNTGIAIVTPAKKIVELLNHTTFTEKKRAELEKIRLRSVQ